MLKMTSNESFANWLKKQPFNGVYRYYTPCDCLIAQYFKSLGFPENDVSVGAQDYKIKRGPYDYSDRSNLPIGWDNIARADTPYGSVLYEPLTYGDAQHVMFKQWPMFAPKDYTESELYRERETVLLERQQRAISERGGIADPGIYIISIDEYVPNELLPEAGYSFTDLFRAAQRAGRRARELEAGTELHRRTATEVRQEAVEREIHRTIEEILENA